MKSPKKITGFLMGKQMTFDEEVDLARSIVNEVSLETAKKLQREVPQIVEQELVNGIKLSVLWADGEVSNEILILRPTESPAFAG